MNKMQLYYNINSTKPSRIAVLSNKENSLKPENWLKIYVQVNTIKHSKYSF